MKARRYYRINFMVVACVEKDVEREISYRKKSGEREMLATILDDAGYECVIHTSDWRVVENIRGRYSQYYGTKPISSKIYELEWLVESDYFEPHESTDNQSTSTGL